MDSNRSGPSRHRALAVFAGVNAVAAWGGAFGLVSGALPLTPELDERLPFDSPVVGGAALALIVAIPLTALAWLAARGDRRTPLGAQAAGVALIGWIVVQILVLQAFSAFQPFYLTVGIGLIIWGRLLAPPERTELGGGMTRRRTGS